MNLCIRAQGWGKGQEVRSLTQKSGTQRVSKREGQTWARDHTKLPRDFLHWMLASNSGEGWVIETHSGRPHLKQHKCEPTPGLPASVLMAGSVYAVGKSNKLPVNIYVQYEMSTDTLLIFRLRRWEASHVKLS